MNWRASFCFMVTMLLSTGVQETAWARAYFASVDEMIKQADAIAIVNVVSAKPAKQEEQGLQYKDLIASGDVQETVLGKLPEKIEIYVRNSYPDAVVDVSNGQYLVFLQLKNGRWSNSNWHLSMRPVQAGKVSWFSHTNSTEQVALEQVAREIQSVRPTKNHK